MTPHFHDRYKFAPQMRHYDCLGVRPVPFLGFFHDPKYRSPSVNTDDKGFRFPGDKSRGGSAPDCYIFGGSAAFGVGSSSDDNTLSSQISYESGFECGNAGGRAFTSTQELLMGLYLVDLSCVKRIYLFSGVNDLVIYYMSKYWSPFGCQFFWQRTRSSFGSNGFMRNLVCRMLGVIFKESFNFNSISIRDYLLSRSGRLPVEEIRGLHLNSGIGKDQLDNDNFPEILETIRKNMEIWRIISKNYKFEIVYCLQPYLPWTLKERCKEEVELENISRNLTGQVSWKTAQEKIDNNKIYMWYRSGIENICKKLEVKFVDMNPVIGDSLDWCFLDKVHLTDLGNSLCAKKLASI